MVIRLLTALYINAVQEIPIKWWFLHKDRNFFKVNGWGLQIKFCLSTTEMALMAKHEYPLASPK